MPVEPVDLLKYAKSVDGTSEAARRAAISRAYYCAYHAALPMASKLPPSPGYTYSGYLRHAELAASEAGRIPKAWRDAARRAGDMQAIGRRYQAALRQRKRADYQLHHALTNEHVTRQLSCVAEIHAYFVKLRNGLADATISRAPNPQPAEPPPQPAHPTDARS
jgi:uncharacterized protein (UPF0332 family)